MDLQFVLFTFKALSPFSPGETDLFFMAPAQRQLLCRPSVTLPSLPCTPSGTEFIVRPLFPPQHCVPEGCLICLPSRLWILQKAAYATHLSSCLPHKVCGEEVAASGGFQSVCHRAGRDWGRAFWNSTVWGGLQTSIP